MPYIPEKHKQYDLLPYCKKHGGEVFEYPSELLTTIENLLGIDLTPYGYKDYDSYFKEIEEIRNNSFEATAKLLDEYKSEIIRLNKKEEWSVCRYIGKEMTGSAFPRLVTGHVYYWPTTADDPIYRGVIDEEEFTCYWYSTEECDWEILEDPTGMAYRTIHEHVGHVSRKEFDHVKKQLDDMEEIECLPDHTS